MQAIFYAMVVNDAVELSVMSRDMAGALKLTLKGLRQTIFESSPRVNKHALLEAQLHRQANPGVEFEPGNDQEESSGWSDALPPSSDDE